jgi:uncharacterized membrane protein YphA (DoxX/SURF4 family)
LRRLFSTFAHGWPGAGLLLMRLVAGLILIAQGLMTLRTAPAIEPIALTVLTIAAGTLLLVGLWTPVSGSLVAVLELWSAFTQPGDPWDNVLLATLGAALALVGPGAWSVDARLFGWKRVDVPDRKNGLQRDADSHD